MRRPILAITMGDPGGVGPEVIAKSLRHFRPDPAVDFLLLGAFQAFELLAKKFELQFPLHTVSSYEPTQFRRDAVNFLDVTRDAQALYAMLQKKRHGKKKSAAERPLVFEIGKVSLANACMSYEALRMATELATSDLIDAIVTAPINKTSMRLVDPRFDGHTDYLAEMSGASPYAMMFVHDKLKVTLVTIHVALKKVSPLVTQKKVYEKIRLTDHFLRTYFNLKKPRIAVCALNPHGQETGSEEERAIVPAVQTARKRKIEAVGPFSADQLFYEAYEGHYDAVVSMYHDQGLGPFKLVAFRDGVNVTLGLPFIRTSPDHGTAFDIAYRDTADPASMEAAIRLARDLLRG